MLTASLHSILSFIDGGLLQLPWWGLCIVTIILTHLTIASVTIFLHRCQAHRGLDLHASVSHFFRFWLWLTTGMVTKQWVAVHRKHHAKCESEEDPHSPQIKGINTVLWRGAELYKTCAADPAVTQRYGVGTPDDWLESNLYSRFPNLGIILLVILNVALFGAAGLLIWAVQMVWIPFWAAGVINGLGHYWGYRNFETLDSSTNISPVGWLIGGEELHNNHHAYPSSAKFQLRKGEFDIGWLYISALERMGLCRIKKEALMPTLDANKDEQDVEGLRAVISHRVHVMAMYARHVMLPAVKLAWPKMVQKDRVSAKRIRQMVMRKTIDSDHLLVTSRDKQSPWSLLQQIDCPKSHIKELYEYRKQLLSLWSDRLKGHEQLLSELNEWCRRAEQSGIQSLQQFAIQLRQMSLGIRVR